MDEPLKVLLVTGPFQVRGYCASTLRLAEGLAAEELDQSGHTVIRDYDGIT